MSRPKVHGERVATAVRLPVDVHRRLQAAAEERDVSANYLAVKAIRAYLDRLAPPVTVVMLPPAPRGWDA